MIEGKPENYVKEAKKALNDEILQKALADVQGRLGRATAAAYRDLPEGPGLRSRAHEIRMEAIENLDILLETFAEKIRQRGGHVFFAEDGKVAVAHCLDIARKHNVKRVVKGKSMVTEEIMLNQALEAAGIEASETDLGEYIIQLAGEAPSHIIAPAIHKTRTQVGRLFSDKLGIPYTGDPPALTKAARKALREKFLAAHMGVSGCNLACAETGHITTLSNEGNIRMATTLPKIHVAFMGMERIVARLEDHEVLLRLIARGAAAQRMAGYVTYVGGPAISGDGDGPDEFHVIVLDNGRSKILADKEFREILCCVRCAACLNVCPVYGKIGGYSYGSTYSGPIGAVLTPLMAGVNRAKDLCLGETLCGACREACPVDIDIPRMLLALRKKLACGDPGWNVTGVNPLEKAIFKVWARAIGSRRVYDFFLWMAKAGQKILPEKNGMLRLLPYPFQGWTMSRDFKKLEGKSFVRRWKDGV